MDHYLQDVPGLVGVDCALAQNSADVMLPASTQRHPHMFLFIISSTCEIASQMRSSYALRTRAVFLQGGSPRTRRADVFVIPISYRIPLTDRFPVTFLTRRPGRETCHRRKFFCESLFAASAILPVGRWPLLTTKLRNCSAAGGDGDRGAAEELMPLIYRELHKLAKRYMNQEDGGQPCKRRP